MLKCSVCGGFHDFDSSPDIGACSYCGGYLIEGEEALPEFKKAIEDLMETAMLKSVLAREKTPKGEN